MIGRLLAEGADIAALNCVRKHLSAIKGGRLAQACRAPLDAWLLSDVVGDDPSVIGSGPTVPDPTTFGDALDVLDRFGGRAAYPAGGRRAPRAGAAGRVAETPKRHADLARVTTRVVGSASRALDGAAAAARARGYEVVRQADADHRRGPRRGRGRTWPGSGARSACRAGRSACWPAARRPCA